MRDFLAEDRDQPAAQGFQETGQHKQKEIIQGILKRNTASLRQAVYEPSQDQRWNHGKNHRADD